MSAVAPDSTPGVLVTGIPRFVHSTTQCEMITLNQGRRDDGGAAQRRCGWPKSRRRRPLLGHIRLRTCYVDMIDSDAVVGNNFQRPPWRQVIQQLRVDERVKQSKDGIDRFSGCCGCLGLFVREHLRKHASIGDKSARNRRAEAQAKSADLACKLVRAHTSTFPERNRLICGS